MPDDHQPGPDLASLIGGARRWPGRRWRLRRLAWRGFLLILVPAGLVTVMAAGSLATYRAVQAAEGHGVKGYFVSTRQSVGEFQLPDGRVTRQHVTFADPPPGLVPRTGAVIPALDTGDVTYVFARRGSRHWHTDAWVLSLVVAVFAAWIWFVPARPLRLRRRAAASGLPAGAAGPNAPGRLTVREAAAHPAWATVSPALLNGDVSTRRVNTALKRAIDRDAYPLLVTVGVPLTDADRAMSPVSGESSRLAELTATLTGLLEDHGVLAATVADSQAWVFLIYTGETGWLPGFQQAVRSAASDHLVALHSRRDNRWQAYRELSRAAGSPRRARDRILLVGVVPLVLALPVGRYGPVPAALTFLGIEAWTIPVAFARRERVISAQLAHPALSFGLLCGVLLTVFMPFGALFVHPASPWACTAGAAVAAVTVTALLWRAQLRFYARMRASAAMRPPHGPGS